MSTATTSPWKTKANNSEGGDYESPTPGSYPATCIGIIDLGSHKDKFDETKQKLVHKIMICWELNETDSKGEPFVVAESCTWSLAKGANLRALVETWTGKTLGDGEEFDILSLVEKPCVVAVAQKINSKGKPFAAIASVSAPMRGMATHTPVNTPFVFHISTVNSGLADIDTPAWVPYHYGKPVGEVIRASDEWQHLPNF